MSSSRRWWWTGLLVCATCFAGCSLEAEDRGETADVPTWESYLAASTREFEGETIYVVEGDIAVTLDELRDSYDRLVEQLTAGDDGIGSSAHESTVNRVNGADDLWQPAAARDLTFCISNAFGTRKARTVDEMTEATRDWERIGNFKFRYVPAEDGACTNSNPRVTFSVRPWTSSGACAFFPSGGGCVARTLVMNYSSFASGAVTSLGVFRHELGHILGLRHEHIRFPGTTCTESGSSREVTPYDSNSVMHYPWCPGATNTGDLFITPDDALGIRSLYPRKADILWRHTTTGVPAIWVDGSPGSTVFVPGVGNEWQIRGVGDFDGDGVSDLLWRSINGDTSIWPSADPARSWWPGAVDNGWQIRGVGDFDGNGKSDILWRSIHGDNSIWFDANPALSWWPGAVDNSWQIVGVGDFDHNGKSDILWRHTAGHNSIWFDANPGLSWWPGAVDGSWQVAGIGDFDLNGKSDILWRNVSGATSIWFDADPARSWWPGALDGNWQIAGVGDFDGNGPSDILWRHADGTNAVWHDANPQQTSFIGSLDHGWQIQGLGDFGG